VSSLRVRAATEADLPAIHALNEAAVPGMSRVPADFFRTWLHHSAWFAVAEFDQAVGGFLLVMGPGAPCDSPNYRWLEERFGDHWYVDRIAVADGRRSLGIGRELYADLFRRALGAGAARITCEVNVRPPNPRSLAFHRREGFVEVGRLVHGPDKEVALLERPL
jgi:predicted GNAT superfamily acetyltransferase